MKKKIKKNIKWHVIMEKNFHRLAVQYFISMYFILTFWTKNETLKLYIKYKI
jgi:hypothetical protein